VPRTRPGDPAREDLAALGHEPAQPADVLVVDEGDLLVAELAELPAPEEELLAASSGVSTERYPPSEKRHSVAYAEFAVHHGLGELRRYLEKLESAGASPEGAGWMGMFRDTLSALQDFLPSIGRERAIVISAIEETVRGMKWRELGSDHIRRLRTILNKASEPLMGIREMGDAITSIHASGLDIYPSALIDEDEDET